MEKDCMYPVGKKNRYTCQECGFQFVTVDKDPGTTPFMCGCQKPGCKGTAQSEFYRVDQSLPATHEWYRASDVEARGMKPHVRQHHDMGGLLLRKASVTMALRDDIQVKPAI